jgi:hypothetical protein
LESEAFILLSQWETSELNSVSEFSRIENDWFVVICLLFKAAKERKLKFDPTQVNWFSKGEYMIVSGADKQCSLYTKEGVKLGLIAEKESWVLCAKQKPDSNYVVRMSLIFDSYGCKTEIKN